MERTVGLSRRKAGMGLLWPSPPPPTGNATFSPWGHAQSQHFPGRSWGREDPGWAEQTRPSPPDCPTPNQFWAFDSVQGLFLVHQLPSVKTGHCYVGGEGGLGGTKPGFT